MSYPRIAAVVLPFCAATLGFFIYRDVTRSSAKTASTQGPAPTASPTATAFNKVYTDARWGKNAEGNANSGTGSTADSTVVYRAFLQQFMADNEIHSVVNAGCGDWEFSKLLDWTGIDYKGYDIVESVIAADKQKYTQPNIQFFVSNIVEDDLPPADLLIVKHVLQHLPNADVVKFLRQLPKYRHVLLINGVLRDTMTAGHEYDIKPGGYRALDVTKPPFGVNGTKLLTYWDGHHMHQVVHITNQK